MVRFALLTYQLISKIILIIKNHSIDTSNNIIIDIKTHIIKDIRGLYWYIDTLFSL